MLTVDVSVHINSPNPAEAGSPESRVFLERAYHRSRTVCSPTLLFIEIAAAIASVLGDAERGLALARAVRGLPEQVRVPLMEG